MTDKAQKRFESAIAFARNILKNSGELLPLVVGFRGEEAFVIACPFEDEASKVKTLKMVQLMFSVEKIEHYVFMHEAWMVQTNDLNEMKGISPSQHSKREEILSLSSVERKENGELEKSGKIFEIARAKDGKPFLTDKEFPKADSYAGRFFSLLDPLPVQITPEMAEKISALFKEAYQAHSESTWN